jgi:hypothetical protein
MKNKVVLRLFGAVVAVGALVSTPALAQGTAVVTGTVIDAATKQPISDVVVTATSPNLQGEQIVVTDPTGLFRIPQLPSGPYTLRFEKEAYRPYSRGDITLRTDNTTRVNVEMLPETLKGEDIVVVGRAPTIDVGSTTTGVNVSSEFIRNIAVVRPGTRGSAARSFESLATIAPGANADLYGVSISGTTSPENQFIIDGLSVNDPGFGINATPLTVDFVQEVNVITGGYMPEYGRATGGIMNVVTKSGSNEFHGSIFGNWTPGALEGQDTPIRRASNAISTTERIWNLGDFGAEIGGPILKDKLWFFAGIAPSFSRSIVEREFLSMNLKQDPNTTTPRLIYDVDPETGFINTTPIPNSKRSWFADQRGIQYIGKLTFLINQDHNVSLSVYGTPTRSGGNGRFGVDPQDGTTEVGNVIGPYSTLAHTYSADSTDVSFKMANSFMDKRLLFDTTIGWHHQYVGTDAADGSFAGSGRGLSTIPRVIYRRTAAGTRSNHSLLAFAPFYDADGDSLHPDVIAACTNPANTAPTVQKCPVPSFVAGGPGFLGRDTLDRIQGKVVGTYLLNVLGHHIIKAGVDVEMLSYNRLKAYSGGVALREATNSTRLDDYRLYGYLQGPNDPFIYNSLQTVNQSTTIGGFIQDSWNVLDLINLNAGVRYDTQTMVANDRTVALTLGNQISPRVGLVYDFTQQGRSKIFANYARFYQNAVLDMIDRSFGGEKQVSALRFATANANRPGCNIFDANAWLDVNTCRSPRNIATVDPLDPNSQYIIIGGDKSAVDYNLKPQSSDEFVVGGEYEVFTDARAGASYTRRYMNEVIEDMSRDEAQTYFIGNPGHGVARDFPKATRDYDAVTVYLNKNFSDLWMAQVSYTWSSLRGNYSGLFRPESGQLDPNINSDFDLVSLLDNRTGPLPGDRTHSLKIFGAKEFVIGGSMSVNLGLTYTMTSGAPTNYMGSHYLYGPTEVFILPRGSGERLPLRHNVDSHLGFAYRLSKDSMIQLSVDVFNVFNFQGVTGIDQAYTAGEAIALTSANCGGRTCTPADLGDADGDGFDDLATDTDGDPIAINPNFGNPTAYQAPRSIRFGAKVTF